MQYIVHGYIHKYVMQSILYISISDE